MPAPTIPTTEEIRDRIISDIETYLSQTTPLFPKAFNRILASASAGAFTILYKFGQWGIKQIFTITQDAESLEKKGEQYNIPRKSAEASELTATFTGTDGTFIPVGKQFRGNSNGLVYQTLAVLEIISGTASGNLECLTSGSESNLTNGSIVTILSPISGIDNQATITATVIEGEDQETIEDYRSRISEREKRPPQGGALVDYIIWAKEVPDVTRAFAWGKREVSSITAGFVLVYPLTDNDPAGRIPSTAKLAEILSYIDDPTRAPTQAVEIQVTAMTERIFDIDVSALTPNTAEIRNKFTENATEYLLEREPKQFIDQLDVNNTISRSGIESIAINSGAESITLELFIDGTVPAIESHTLEYFELAKIGNITFP